MADLDYLTRKKKQLAGSSELQLVSEFLTALAESVANVSNDVGLKPEEDTLAVRRSFHAILTNTVADLRLLKQNSNQKEEDEDD